MEIKVDKLVEISVPGGDFICYEMRQTAHPFKSVKILPRKWLPHAKIWYSTNAPHNQIQYHGYFQAPISLGNSIVEMSRGKIWHKLVKIEPSDITKIIPKGHLLSRMKNYDLLEK